MGCKKDRRLCRCVGGRVYRSALEQINFKLKCELSLCMFLKRILGDVGTCQVILQFMIPGVFWYIDVAGDTGSIVPFILDNLQIINNVFAVKITQFNLSQPAALAI